MENFILFLILLILSFIFSGYETAFFSLSASQRERLSLKYPSLGLQRFQADRTTLLNTLLLMNLLVNTLNSFVFASIVENMKMLSVLSDRFIMLAQILGFFVVLLFTGEITPKVIAIRNPEFFVKNFSFLIMVFYKGLGWIIRPVSTYIKLIFARKESEGINAERIIAELKGFFPDVEGVFTGIGIIRGNVKRILKNKKYVVSIQKHMAVKDIDRIVLKHPHSIYPVEDNEEVVEILNLRESDANTLKFKEVKIIPETLKIVEYLKETDDELNGFRVVVSEHGEYIGIVTFDDLLKVFASHTSIKKIKDSVYIVEGLAQIEEIENKLGICLDTNADTFMGFIMEKTGRIPEEGERLCIGNLSCEVLSRKQGEIKLVKVEVK